jgi:hypothetical protein
MTEGWDGQARATVDVMEGDALDLMRDYDLGTLGYRETEFAVSGTAVSYEIVGERGADGVWDAVSVDGGDAAFRTRCVVRRPVDGAQFSGTVVVEWHNVSGGLDAAPDWNFFHRELCRQGHAWVGVSAQKAGLDGGGIVEGIHMKLIAPERYGSLVHPGDAWSFDMFTQVGELVRGGDGDLLDGLMATQLIAAGESQSAACLVTYINAIDPLTRLFDGYFVHGRPASGVAIDGVFIPSSVRVAAAAAAELEGTRLAISTVGERIRADARVPVFVLQSETDLVVLGGALARQPDEGNVLTWEMAGAAHADTYTVSAGRVDDGTLDGARLAELMRPTQSLLFGQTARPVNAGPQQHYVAQAALSHLVRWAGGGEAPPPAPPLALDDAGTAYRVDEWGNAVGGLRTPWVDAPVATMSGLGQTGETFAFLFGTTDPFDAATLASVYPGGRDEYLARFSAALDEAVAAGYLLADDRDEIAAVGAASYPMLLAGAA